MLVASPTVAIERFSLPGMAGGTLSESVLDRGDTLLVVWASWSPRCHDVAERLRELRNRWQHQARLASVVFQEEPETIRRFLALGEGLAADHGLPPIYFDTTGSFAKQQDVATLPTLLVIRDGEVLFRGKLPPDADTVIARTLDTTEP